ncbi:hypothetical protein [Legionella pneumophila]|nr:hypothetical protein [Legionella pneumophila]MCW8493264.1 hypothetical protein [Legionella pneumophila]
MSSYAEQQTILLIADPKVLAVPITDNHEPMVDLKKQSDIGVF